MSNFSFSYQDDNKPNNDQISQRSFPARSLDHVFGPNSKNAGKTVQQLIDEKPGSMRWIIDNVNFELDNEAYEYLVAAEQGKSAHTSDDEDPIVEAKFDSIVRKELAEIDRIIWGDR